MSISGDGETGELEYSLPTDIRRSIVIESTESTDDCRPISVKKSKQQIKNEQF